jgi:hypothetical protein
MMPLLIKLIMCTRAKPLSMGIVPRGDVLPIHSFSGARWEAALEIIASGEGTVSIGPVYVKRWVGWPGADDAIHLILYTAALRENLTQATAEGDVDAGRAAIGDAERADGRLTALFEALRSGLGVLPRLRDGEHPADDN